MHIPIKNDLIELGRVRINCNKMKIENTTLSEQIQDQISKIEAKRGEIDTPSRQIHGASLYWRGTYTSITNVRQ